MKLKNILHRKTLTKPWFIALVIFALLLVAIWPRYEFRAQVPSPDGSQALMVYVDGTNFFIAAPGDWAYKPAYAYLVDAEGKPVGPRFSRNCEFQLGDVYNGREYRARWSILTVEIAKFSRIDRETGRADCWF